MFMAAAIARRDLVDAANDERDVLLTLAAERPQVAEIAKISAHVLDGAERLARNA